MKAHDNVDTDAFGNPFGLTGVWDALSVITHNLVVQCDPPLVDSPVWGCTDQNGDAAGGPPISGIDYEVFLVGAPGWFTEGTLPSEIPSLAELEGVYGLAGSWSGGIMVSSAEMKYTTLTVIPEPSTALLIGIGLLGLAGNRRL